MQGPTVSNSDLLAVEALFRQLVAGRTFNAFLTDHSATSPFRRAFSRTSFPRGLRRSPTTVSVCACQTDLPDLHGPYWYRSYKANSKALIQRLSERGAQLCARWTDNDRQPHDLLAKIR
jgi:hypothetical protein